MPTTPCPQFGKSHYWQYDMELSTPDKTVFSCQCGAELPPEPEDSGTGA